MKNPTILKDELKVLVADRSAVITELRRAGDELKDTLNEIAESESKLEKLNNEITERAARLVDINSRAVSVKGELDSIVQDLKNMEVARDAARNKNNQELKLHLGRIKELEEKEKEICDKIDNLKKIFDSNSEVYTKHKSEKNHELRELDSVLTIRKKEAKEAEDRAKKIAEDEKKATKERLKREDKIRKRERILDSRELSITKREDDVIAMSKDMVIVYGRLKELYAEVRPDVDLDKLITKID